jgi:hypothetical protein
MANINELMEGWGFGEQTAIGTANTSTAIWRQTNLNTKPWAKIPVNEDDRAEIGKGHEFPTQLFRSHYNMPPFELSKYASSEFLTWAMSFSMGNVTLTDQPDHRDGHVHHGTRCQQFLLDAHPEDGLQRRRTGKHGGHRDAPDHRGSTR